MPSVGIKVMIWKILQNQKESPENDILAVGCYPEVCVRREKRVVAGKAELVN